MPERNVFEIKDIPGMLLCVEFVDNLINLMDEKQINRMNAQIDFRKFQMLKDNMNKLVNHFGFSLYHEENEKLIIVEQKQGAFEVAEELNNGIEVIRYNHFLLKGKLDEKRKILINLAAEFEARKSELNRTEFKSLCDDLGYILNNLNIRHNNIEGKYKKNYVAELPDDELEELYDITYDMFLNVIMAYKYLSIKTLVKDLKGKIS